MTGRSGRAAPRRTARALLGTAVLLAGTVGVAGVVSTSPLWRGPIALLVVAGLAGVTVGSLTGHARAALTGIGLVAAAAAAGSASSPGSDQAVLLSIAGALLFLSTECAFAVMAANATGAGSPDLDTRYVLSALSIAAVGAAAGYAVVSTRGVLAGGGAFALGAGALAVAALGAGAASQIRRTLRAR